MLVTGRPSGGDNALNSSHGSGSKLGTQSRPSSRPHSHVSRAYSRITHRPTTGRFNQWDNSTPGNILELSGYHGNKSQLSTCAHCDHAFTTAGLRVPLLLLCGHTYCTNCIEKACSTYPSAIRCGQCHTNTPVDQQGAAHMMQNEALLEVLDNKQLQQSLPAQQRGRETCAECERQPATVYCSNCSAAFCAPCSHKSHAGSKVRGKHTPVPITQRPQPNPTCKRHPGQTCMLYCETEGVPMCVLCKFYGQHRYHKYELLSKVCVCTISVCIYVVTLKLLVNITTRPFLFDIWKVWSNNSQLVKLHDYVIWIYINNLGDILSSHLVEFAFWVTYQNTLFTSSSSKLYWMIHTSQSPYMVLCKGRCL